MKRLFDIFFSCIGLVLLSPFLFIFSFLIYLQDFFSPFYVADRVGLKSKPFRMVKLRSMIVDADKSGVDSTSSIDSRITAVGKIVRKYKLDEFTQLFNVLKGDMSLVGPRPNVQAEINLYSDEEKLLLTVKPGITDFSSIVFSDEGEILKNSSDPDLDYNQLIRPGKSLLGLFYIENKSLFLDFYLCFITVLAILSRERSLGLISNLLAKKKAPNKLIELSSRKNPLFPMPPPGFKEIVTSRKVI